MIATISPSPSHYQHSLNTLKYADRAKEIKTHVRRNQSTVQEHVSKLRDQIATLQKENADLKAALCQPRVSRETALLDVLPIQAEVAQQS
jgi:kinesin family protein 18/19